MPTPSETCAGYASMWSRARLDPDRQDDALALARRIVANKPQYAAVQAATGVPWPVIAVLHYRESGLSFGGHLHNGDSLNDYTHRVPAGRPRIGHGPPFTWIESAVDALTMKGHELQNVGRWTVERILHECEKYNGWGYRGKCNSPYLWSWTSEYRGGKYIRDHVFDPGFRDAQAGCVALLKALAEIDGEAAQLLASREGAFAPPFGTSLPPQILPPASIAYGETSDRVAQLQRALAARNYDVGEIDGEFGPRTRAAVAAFQRDRGLQETGVADQQTQQALAIASAEPGVPGGPLARRDDLIRTLLEAAFRSAATPAPTGPTGGAAPSLLPILLTALLGREFNPAAAPLAAPPIPSIAPPPPPPPPPDPTQTPFLSPLDKILGGQALAGKKTLIAALAYVVLAILQAMDQVGTATGPLAPSVNRPAAAAPAAAPAGGPAAGPAAAPAAPRPGVAGAGGAAGAAAGGGAGASAGAVVAATPAGTRTPTGEILTTIILAFGGLGMLAKLDRLVLMLNAARRSRG